MRHLQRLIIAAIAAATIVMAAAVPAHAATTQITGGTNGAGCGSGGYFSPSSVTLTSGDTVTINVPADDPYTGGIEVHGFLEGTFVVARGGSHTTTSLTGNVSYYGTWPNEEFCMKGSGTITIKAPTPPPPPQPPASPTPTPTPTPAPQTPSPAVDTAPVSTPDATNGTAPAVPAVVAANPSPQEFSLTAKVIGLGGGIVVVLIAGLLVWRLVLAPRSRIK